MPTTPGITLTATLDDISGDQLTGASVVVALCGYGLALPRIAGTAMVASVGPTRYIVTENPLSITLWGNDQITPSGTYYAISVMDTKKQVIQSGIYQFTGTQTIDLSTAPQLSLPPAILEAGYHSEGLTGAYNGVNKLFAFSAPLDQAQFFMLFQNGLLIRPTLDYTFQGGFAQLGTAPQPGDWLWGVYVSQGQLLPFGLPAVSEAPAGAINGVNESFTLTATPSITQMLFVYLNGVFQRPGTDYFLEGAEIIFANPPQPGDWLWATFPT